MDDIEWLLYCWECSEWVRRVRRLSWREAHVLALRDHWDGWGKRATYDDIQRKLGITYNEVRKAVKSGRRKMLFPS